MPRRSEESAGEGLFRLDQIKFVVAWICLLLFSGEAEKKITLHWVELHNHRYIESRDRIYALRMNFSNSRSRDARGARTQTGRARRDSGGYVAHS